MRQPKNIKKGFTLLEAAIVISLLSVIMIYLMKFYSHTAKVVKMEDAKVEAFVEEYTDVNNLRTGHADLIDNTTGKLEMIPITGRSGSDLSDVGKILYHYEGSFLEYYHLD